MRSKHICILFLLISTWGATSCEKVLMDKDMTGDAVTSFDYLWTKFDEQYSFFDVKQVDWDQIYSKYRPMVYEGMSDDSLFRVMGAMINELNDGHVNLSSPFDIAHSHEVYDRMYADGNFDLNTVIVNYLTVDYHTTAGFHHQALRNGQVAYILYTSFSSNASTAALSKVINSYPKARGMIIDIRQNGGGEIENIWNILKLMPSNHQLLYSTQIKSGPHHNDFAPLETVTAPDNNTGYDTYDKPVVVITDRGSFSAASFFPLCAKEYSNITVIGDTTGGGLGLPAGGQLPNGWLYRLSITRTLDKDGHNYENGVPPDEVVKLDRSLLASGKDNIIERACDIILSSK